MPKASRKELRKTLFKEGSESREKARKDAKEKRQAIEAATPVKAPAAKRYILFVGNMPYDVTEEDIKAHFKSANPSAVRIRKKGICFLEFSGESAANRMHQALAFHHSDMKGRRINVEFSAGGGGNSSHRKEKIKQKNTHYQDELRNKKQSDPTISKSENDGTDRTASAEPVSVGDAESTGVHPSRLAALRKSK